MLKGRPVPRARGAATLLLLCSILATQSAVAAPIKVACIGEHTTHSHAFPAGNRETQPVGAQEYPAQLQTLLGPGYEVRNFGDCCSTVLQGYKVAETHPYIAGTNPGDGDGYKESIAFLPDVVIIGSWGRHDWGLNKAPTQVFTLQGFQDGYEDLVKRYQALSTHPKIFVSLPIPILNGQGDMPNQGVKTMDVLPSVNAVADKYKLPVVDLYTPFFHHIELFKQAPANEGEGEHVTNAGLTVIANAVYAAMQKDLMGGSGGAGGSAGTSGGGGAAAGAAGASGTGGAGGNSDATAGTGGMASGGTSGTAGEVAAVGGQAGAGTTPATAGTNGATTPPSDDSSSGCACRTAGGSPGPGRTVALFSGFLVLGLLGRRRR